MRAEASTQKSFGGKDVFKKTEKSIPFYCSQQKSFEYETTKAKEK